MKTQIERSAKKLLLAMALASGISAPAIAMTIEGQLLVTPEVAEQDRALFNSGMISEGEFAALQRDPRRDRREDRREDRRDRREERREDRRDRRDETRRPAPPRPMPPRAPVYVYQCFAENGRRQLFAAEHRFDARFAQREAVRNCYRYSRFCYELGCRQIRR